MAIVEVPEFFLPAPVMWDAAAAPGYNEHTLDTTTRKVAFILPILKTGQVETFEFKINAVTQAPANGLKVSFQGVNETSGAIDGIATYYYTITSGIAEETWMMPPYLTNDGTSGGFRLTFDEAAIGKFFACVIEFALFSIGDSLTIHSLKQNAYAPKGALIMTADIPGAYTRASGIPVMALVYENSEYVPIPNTCPAFAINGTGFDLASSPDEIGLAFTIPAPMRVGGAYVFVNPLSSTGFYVVLYDTETNEELERVRVNSPNGYYDNSNGPDYIPVYFSTNRLIQPNQIYILSVTPIQNETITYWFIDAYSTAQMAAMPGGSTWFYKDRTDSGGWTGENTSRHPLFGLVVTGVDHDISGGSGGGGWEGNP